MKNMEYVGLLITAISLAGCSVFGSDYRLRSKEFDDDIVASNFSHMVYQVYDSSTVEFNMLKSNSEFDSALSDDLLKMGYAIRLVDDANGKGSYLRTNRIDSKDRRVYQVMVDNKSLAREYRVDRYGVYPVTPVSALGFDNVSFDLNDHIFGRADRADYVSSIVAGVDSEVRAMNASARNISPENVNMYDTRETFYKLEFEDTVDIRKEILVFGNDSFRLGKRNKRVIDDIVKSLNRDTDVVSIIGCSHGKSTVGNGALAISRGNRVKEEFIFAGVENNLLLDEVCYAPIHFDEMMPRRGVVVTVKRAKA